MVVEREMRVKNQCGLLRFSGRGLLGDQLLRMKCIFLREPRAQAGAAPTVRTLVFTPSFDSEACQLPGAEKKKWLLVLFLFSLCF